jgi:hypothetical protein
VLFQLARIDTKVVALDVHEHGPKTILQYDIRTRDKGNGRNEDLIPILPPVILLESVGRYLKSAGSAVTEYCVSAFVKLRELALKPTAKFAVRKPVAI